MVFTLAITVYCSPFSGSNYGTTESLEDYWVGSEVREDSEVESLRGSYSILDI